MGNCVDCGRGSEKSSLEEFPKIQINDMNNNEIIVKKLEKSSSNNMKEYADVLCTILRGEEIKEISIPKYILVKSIGIGNVKRDAVFTLANIQLTNIIVGRVNLDFYPGESAIATVQASEVRGRCEFNVDYIASFQFEIEIVAKDLVIVSQVSKREESWGIDLTIVRSGSISIVSKNTGIKKQLFEALRNMVELDKRFKKSLEKGMKKRLEKQIRKRLEKFE